MRFYNKYRNNSNNSNNSNKYNRKNISTYLWFRLTALFIVVTLIFSLNIQAFAEESTEVIDEYQAEAEKRKNDPVATNDIEGWPAGPIIGADSAILMDANTHQILYYKNADAMQFPASTTKIMACLVAMESGVNLNDKVTVSQAAIDANDWDGSNMALSAGEILTVQELLEGILITSANEACNALAEHVAGSMEAFVDKMNARAKSLGCINTHFVTTNGLHDENHYTSAYDLALIGCEFFKYDILCNITRTTYLELPETEEHAQHSIYSKNKLLEGRTYAYPYLVGTKTGYTGSARQTLVSCAEKNGMRLVCVIMKEESPDQFADTVALFDYGFNNFTSFNMLDYESPYKISQADFFESGKDIFGSSMPLTVVNNDFSVWIPAGGDNTNLQSRIVYDSPMPGNFATVDYYYNGWLVGDTGIRFAKTATITSSTDINIVPEEEIQEKENKPVLVNIEKVIIRLVIIIVVVFLLIVASTFFKHYFTKQRIKNIKKYFKRRRNQKQEEERRKRSQKRDEKYEKKRSKKPDLDYIPPEKNMYQKRKPPQRRRDFDDYY